MNSATQCIILLACVAICTSASIKRCSCIKASKAVNPSLIVEVKEYKPRPHCPKSEVIVRLKDNSSLCLDPDSQFTKKILRRAEMNRAKMTSSSKTTTVAPTASVPTSS